MPDEMDQKENLLWLAQHKENDPKWKERFNSLVSSIATQRNLPNEAAEPFARQLITTQKKALPK